MSFHHEKEVKTRKSGYCSGCLSKFEKGIKMIKYSGADSYDFYHGYLCHECKDFIENYPNYFNDDIWHEGDIGTARYEEARSDI